MQLPMKAIALRTHPLALILLLACACLLSLSRPALGAAIAYADSGEALVKEFLSGTVDTIFLAKDVMLEERFWPPTSTLLTKSVTVQGAVEGGSRDTYPELNWNWVNRKLTLDVGVTLTIRSVVMSGFRPELGPNFAFLSHSPNATLIMNDVIGYYPVGVTNAVRLPGLKTLPRPAGWPPVPQVVVAWPGCYGWSNAAGTQFCLFESTNLFDSAGDVPASTTGFGGSGGYVAWYQNCTNTSPNLMTKECLSKGAVQCYADAVAAATLQPQPPSSSHSSPNLNVILPATIVGAVAALSAFGALVAWLVVSARHRRESPAYRKFKAPLAGEETTVVVTDIQGSTPLWESLPTGIMDASIKLHHTCIRTALPNHYGTESATEGDSFILCFHTATLAISFCLEVQEKLMQVAWPAALLMHANAACLWATPQTPSGVLTLHPSPPKNPRLEPQNGFNDTVELSDVSAALAEFRLPKPQQQNRLSQDTPPRLSGGRLGTWRMQRQRRNSATMATLTTSKANSPGYSSHRQDCNADGKEVPDWDAGLAPSLHVPGKPWLQDLIDSWTMTKVPPAELPEEDAALSDLGRVLVYRGLRVRMGLHSGVDASDITHNSISGRTQYVGVPLAKAKAVENAAPGGMVLLSPSTFKQATLGSVMDDVILLHMGEFKHSEDAGLENSQALYAAATPGLLIRMAASERVNKSLQIAAGTLDAPVGVLSISFMHIVGFNSIHISNEAMAGSIATMFETLVSEQLQLHNGYMVEMDRGFCLAAFPTSHDAMKWGLACRSEMMKVHWPSCILEHELCEEVLAADGEVLMRGPRIKVGIDTSDSQVYSEVSPSTGRMTYRGKVMNRAARIASKASSGKVFVSNACWAMCSEGSRDLFAAASQGVMDLKGVGKLELHSVMWRSTARTEVDTTAAAGQVSSACLGKDDKASAAKAQRPHYADSKRLTLVEAGCQTGWPVLIDAGTQTGSDTPAPGSLASAGLEDLQTGDWTSECFLPTLPGSQGRGYVENAADNVANAASVSIYLL